MTTLASITAGARITAAMMQGIAPLGGEKTADESVTSSTTLQNDNQLFASVSASATYLFFCYLNYEGAAAGDLKFSWSVPTSATMRFALIGQTTGGSATVNTTNTESSSIAIGCTAAATLDAATMIGTLVTSSTSGTLQLQWAQNSSSGTATIVHAQSFLALWQVS